MCLRFFGAGGGDGVSAVITNGYEEIGVRGDEFIGDDDGEESIIVGWYLMGEGEVERFGTKWDEGEMGVRGDDDDEIIVNKT